MHRRELLAGLGAAALMSGQEAPTRARTFLEVKFYRLHNTSENQSKRLSSYLESGLGPALSRNGAKLDGAFSITIGPDAPSVVTLTQFSSLQSMGETLAKLQADKEHAGALEQLSSGPGLPFVRVESSLLHSFEVMPEPSISGSSSGADSHRVFELRTYESQSFLTLARKVGMFNDGEAKIFERLGFRPVFFGETIVGAKQPNLMYMLSYDDWSARERLWQSFISDPGWKKLSSQAGLSDPAIVANISNVLLSPLPFSAIR